MGTRNSAGRSEEQAERWNHVPEAFHYLRTWATKLGVRGLTVYFGRQPPLSKLASKDELVELKSAYETIARRGDVERINEWCLSIRAGDAANEAKEQIRGLLLLFESLADRGLAPFTDGNVRFVSPDPPPFDWNLVPAHLSQWKPWLKKFEDLRTENDLFQYVQNADDDHLCELAALDDLLRGDGEPLRDWCIAKHVDGNPAGNEAFQAGWLFLLVYFAKSEIERLSNPKGSQKRKRKE